MIGLYYQSKHYLINELSKADIQYIEYGNTITFLIPTDKYFLFNTATLNDLLYNGLNSLIKLIKKYPNGPIYIATFSDNIGDNLYNQHLSQKRSEAMLTFLWANGIALDRLNAEGYGQKNPIADNQLIRGNALNRRIEIQIIIPDPHSHPISP